MRSRTLHAPREAKLLAGGHSLIPVNEVSAERAENADDISRITGALGHPQQGRPNRDRRRYRASDVASSALLRRVSVIAEAADSIGDPQVRKSRKPRGSIAHADSFGRYLR